MTTRKRQRRDNNIRYGQIPDEQDWVTSCDHATLRWAKEHFFGKTLEEAEELFIRNPGHWQEAIWFMPSGAFRYYVHAYINYLLSNQSEEDSGAASSFLNLIKSRIEDGKNDLRGAVWLRVKETIEHIRSNPNWFDWNESVYGNLEARTTRLLAWDGE